MPDAAVASQPSPGPTRDPLPQRSGSAQAARESGTLRTEPAMLSIGARAVGLVGVFVFNIVLSRFFGAVGAGAFQFGLALCIVTSTLARLGTGFPLLRDTARHLSERNPSAVLQAYLQSLAMVLLGALGVTAAVLVLRGPLVALVADPAVIEPVVAVMVWSIAPMALIVINSRLLAGSGASAAAVLSENALVPIVALALLPVFFSAGVAQEAGAAYVASTVLVAAGTFVLARGRLGRPSRLSWSVADGFALVRSGAERARATAYFFWNELLLMLLGTMDFLLLGVLAGNAELGVFNAVIRLALASTWVRLPAYTRISPQLAALAKTGDRAGLRRVCVRGARTVTLGTLPFLAPMLIAPGACLALFGTEFRVGATALVVVALGKLAEVAAGPTRELLLMSGHEREVVISVSATLAVQIGLALLLVPRFGLMGAAATNLAMTVFLAGAGCYYVRRRLGFFPWCLGPA